MPTQPAVLGTARLNNFRLGYNPPALAAKRAARVRVLIAGVFANARVRMAGFSIHDAINEQPNTCSLTVDGTAPTPGQDLRVYVNSDAPRLLFNGTLQTVDESYEGKPGQLAWACTAVDDLVRINRRRPFGTWANVSATTIAQYLVTTYAPGFTGVNIAAALPAVSVTFDGSDTFSGCMGQLATLIGGYYYVEDLDVHLFLTEATSTPDTIDSTPHRFLHEPPISIRSDDSLLRTRIIGKGAGTTITTDVASGSTTLPVQDSYPFENAAGQAIIDATATIISYTGKATVDGDGTVTTGPTASPSAPSASVSTTKSGGPLGAIAYYKIDVSAEGPSEPSPVSSTVTPTTVSTPSAITSGGVQHTAVGTYNSTPKDYYTSASVTLSRSGSSFSFTLAGAVAGARVRIFQSGTGAFDGIWTIASVSGSTVTVTGISTSAASSDTAYISFVTDGPLDGTYDYGVSFVSALGETAISSAKQVTAALHAGIGFNGTGILTPTTGGSMTSSVTYKYWTSVTSANGESSPQQITGSSATMGGSDTAVTVATPAGATATAFADLRVNGLNFYRSRASGSTPFLVRRFTREQLSQGGYLDNSTTLTWTDTAADSSLTTLPSNNPIGAAIGLWGITTTSDARATGRRLWRKLGGVWYPLALLGDRDVTVSYMDTTPDADLGRGALGLDPKPFGGAAVNVTVPVGASGTLLRRLYRTKAGPTTKAYFCGTVDANTITAYEDTKSDEDLGEEMEPYSKRRTLIGSTTLRVLDLAKLLASGWVRSGSQVIKFTGRSASSGEGTLTGIPASGPGSITADISTDAEVTIEPHLTGVSGITAAIDKGTNVRLYLVRNDTAAQTALIAKDLAQGRVTDGVVENTVTADVLTAELIALCDADLERYSFPIVTVTFDGRDTKLKSGKPITFNLSSPAISATLTLLSVDISEIDLAPSGLAPRFHCVASTTATSLESILRRLLKKAA